ncbi:MAG: phosphatase PAP2 family protein [Rubrivivax sp.]|nr:MAG: phosphatase PAP2 family protein [Rubrivivax sp.]
MLSSETFWFWISRLGESQTLLPVALVLAVAVVLLDANRSVRSWVPALALAIALTVASKIAFMGWGLGVASLDFTGFSGHAMLAAAIYPVLGHVFARRRLGSTAWWGAAMGYGLAVLIAISRVTTQAHSVSEAASGFALGALASACAMGLMVRPQRRIPRWAWLGGMAWLLSMSMVGKSAAAHGAIIKVALALSHRTHPYERADLHRLSNTPTSSSVQPLHRQKMVFFGH